MALAQFRCHSTTLVSQPAAGDARERFGARLRSASHSFSSPR